MISTKDPPIVDGPFQAILDSDCATDYDPGVSYKISRIIKINGEGSDELPLGFDADAMRGCYRLLLIAYESLESDEFKNVAESEWRSGWRACSYYDLWIEPGGVASIQSKSDGSFCVQFRREEIPVLRQMFDRLISLAEEEEERREALLGASAP